MESNNDNIKYSPENKRQVPKPLQTEFYNKIKGMISNYEKFGGTWCMFGIKNLMIQAMAHGYYMEFDNYEEQNKELLEALKKVDTLLDFVINATESGNNRNLLTDANIYAKSAIHKASTL